MSSVVVWKKKTDRAGSHDLQAKACLLATAVQTWSSRCEALSARGCGFAEVGAQRAEPRI